MTYIDITKFVLINQVEKDHSMIETRCLKNVFFFSISSFHCKKQPKTVRRKSSEIQGNN